MAMTDSGFKVLIVDDTEEQYVLIRYYLNRTSHQFHQIDHAADYQTAREIITRREHDLYLVDYYLGQRDGLELIHEAVSQGCTAPMLLMTGASDSRIAVSAIRSGAIDYLDKTELNPSVLDRAIRYATERAEIINALRDSEERYRDLFENSAELIQSVNAEGRFEYVNGAWQKALGYSAAEVDKLTLFDVIHPSQHEHCMTLLKEILSGNTPHQIETIFVTRDGRDLIVEGNITVKVVPGKEPATRGIFRDVTRRRQLEIAEREQRVLAEALRDTAAALNSTLDFNEILDRILTNVELVVPHESANIMLIEKGVTRFALIRDYTDHKFEESMVNLRFIVAETPSFRQVYETRQPLIIPDVSQYPDWVDAPESDWIGSYAAIPIQSADTVIGFLNLNSTTPNFFTPALVNRLLAFSNQIALAVENAHLYEQAQELAAANERQRLARELHDTVTQTLFATSITAEALTRVGNDAPQHIRNGLSDLHRLTRRAMAGMRSLMLELRPETMRQTPLDALLKQLVETFTGRTQIKVNASLESQLEPPLEVKIALYRIAQEALNTMVQQTNATQTTVTLRDDTGGLDLVIQDDGQGLSAHENDFRHMANQAQAVGATWEVTSGAANGTMIKVHWAASGL